MSQQNNPFKTDAEKWQFLADIVNADAKHPEIIRIARELLAAASGDTWRFVQLAHTVARDWISQVTDTDRLGREDIAGLTRPPSPDDAIDALRRGKDDCDAKARLFVALCLAAGIRARMVPYWMRGSGPLRPWGEPTARLSHVAAEVLFRNQWRPIETTLARARPGELGSDVPKETTGLWLKP